MTKSMSLLALVLLALTACQQGDERSQDAAAAEAFSLISNCLLDVTEVPIERSGNCVGAFELWHAHLVESDCLIPNDDCEEPSEKWRSVNLGWNHALILSLWKHGRPSNEAMRSVGAEPDDNEPSVYASPDMLRRLFEHCLKQESENAQFDEPDQPKARMLDAHSVHHPPLEEGQLCYRKHYQRTDSLT